MLGDKLAETSFDEFAEELVNNGVVTITAVEDLIPHGQLVLSLHPDADIEMAEVRKIADGVRDVNLSGQLFDVHCDIDPWAPSELDRITVFHESPETRYPIQGTTIPEGIDRIQSVADEAISS